MDLLTAIVVSCLAFLGATSLIGHSLKEIGKPKKWNEMNQSRRSFITFSISLIGGLVAGIYGYTKKNKKEFLLNLLFDLEVNLVQLEGLLLNALSSQELISALEVIKKQIFKPLLNYLNSYHQKVSRLLLEVEGLAPKELVASLKPHDNRFTSELVKITTNNPDNEIYSSSLSVMLESIGSMRSIVRKSIHKLSASK